MDLYFKDSVSGEPIAGANVLWSGATKQTDAGGKIVYATGNLNDPMTVTHASYKSLTIGPPVPGLAAQNYQMIRADELPPVVVTPPLKPKWGLILAAVGVAWYLHHEKMI